MRPYETKRKTTQARTGKLGHKCGKCGGYILIGGLRMGMYADDMESCLSCGLSSESPGFTKFSIYNGIVHSEWVEMKA
jgi:hypothetical protein